MLRCFSWQFVARVGGGTPSLDSGQGLSMLPRPEEVVQGWAALSLLLARVSSNVLAATNIRVGIPAALQRTDIDIDISLAAVGNYELHLGLWLSVYRHSVGSLKSMCLDELAMSGAIKYCLCRWHFACGLMSSKQGYH